jgi:hypothetical protein
MAEAGNSLFGEFANLLTYRYPVSSTVAYGCGIATYVMLVKQGLHHDEGPDMYIGGPAVAFLISGLLSKMICSAVSRGFNAIVARRPSQNNGENPEPKYPQATP